MKQHEIDVMLHRYFDGELSPEEEAAFLERVSQDPLLMTQVHSEAMLGVALINDAYGLEPPPHIRDSVLTTVLARQSTISVWQWWQTGVVTVLFWMLSLVVPPSVVEQYVEAKQTMVSASNIDPISTGLNERRSKIQPNKPEDCPVQEPQSSLHSDDSSSAAVSIANFVPAHVDRRSSVHSDSRTINIPALESSHVLDIPFVDALSILATPTTYALKLSKDLSDKVSVFAEIGRSSFVTQTTGFDDGARTQAQRTQSSVYVAIGAGYRSTINVFGERLLTASGAVAVSVAGMSGFVDVGADIVSIGTLQIQAGMRLAMQPMDLGTSIEPQVGITPTVGLLMNF